MQEHHGTEVWYQVCHIERCFGGEEGDDAECWEGLETFVSFTICVTQLEKASEEGDEGRTRRKANQSSLHQFRGCKE